MTGDWEDLGATWESPDSIFAIMALYSWAWVFRPRERALKPGELVVYQLLTIKLEYCLITWPAVAGGG